MSTQSDNQWSEYIKKHGIAPQSAFKLMVFTEANPNVQAMTLSESRTMFENNKDKSILKKNNINTKKIVNNLNESKQQFNDIKRQLSKLKQLEKTELKTNDNDQQVTELPSMQYVGMDDSLQQLVDCGQFDTIFAACINTQNADKAILLCSSYSCTNTQLAAQNKAKQILTAKKCRFQYIDGALIENKNQRNQLFKISNLKGKYPQIFVPKRTYSNLTCHHSKAKAPIKPQKPIQNCRAYFSGLVVGGTYNYPHTSVAYQEDKCSEYVGAGEYRRNSTAFPKAVAATFDGIAIDRNTRVIIYEKENFQGKVLLDRVGPAIINNVLFKNASPYSTVATDTFPDPTLQSNFPPHVRSWSGSNMQLWSSGSVKVIGVN